MHKLLCTATLALAGFAITPLAQAQTLPCSQPNNHCIVVTVAQGAGGAPEIHVDVRELYIRGASHVIFWRIDNTGAQRYRFPANGIEFKSADGKREFSCAAQGTSGLVIRCKDPNAAKGRFEYAVNLTGSPAVPPLDPWVINQ
jgi:hypothetical protein